jgi:hypothetical protein
MPGAKGVPKRSVLWRCDFKPVKASGQICHRVGDGLRRCAAGELDKQALDNRGVAGELLLRRAEKIKTRFGEDIRIGHCRL